MTKHGTAGVTVNHIQTMKQIQLEQLRIMKKNIGFMLYKRLLNYELATLYIWQPIFNSLPLL